MTISFETPYEDHALLEQFTSRNQFIAIRKPTRDDERDIVISHIRNAEETASTHELHDNTDPNMFESAIYECIRISKSNYGLSHVNLDDYPGTVICVHAHTLTSKYIANEYFKKIWEIYMGMKDYSHLKGKVFFAISIDPQLVPEWIHEDCIMITGLKRWAKK